MKHIRSLLFFVAAVFLVIGFTSNAAAQKVDDYGIALADTMEAAFSDSSDMLIMLEPPDGLSIGDVINVSYNATDLMLLKFAIVNNTTVDDTLQIVRFTSANDTANLLSRVSLFREGVVTSLRDTSNFGGFEENVEIAFSGLNEVIPTGDSVVFYFQGDVDSNSVNLALDGKFIALKVMGGDVEMALAGTAPPAGDVLQYIDAGLPYKFYRIDTKPPDLEIGFDLAGDFGGGCLGNGIVNIGDSIVITAYDMVGDFEIDYAWGFFQAFGGGVDSVQFDSVNLAGDGVVFPWVIPDDFFDGAIDVYSGFYMLVVGAVDSAGNATVDTLVLDYPIDTEKPVFDEVVVNGDTVHVWSELTYDANGDGIAAIGDSVSFYAYLTSNDFGEIDLVTIDLSNWGPFGTFPMEDISGDRRYYATIRVGSGDIDVPADDTSTVFYVTAYDNACNSTIDSNYAPYAIDNDPPDTPPLSFTYTRLYDHDMNNIVNIGDSIRIEIDASNTDDLEAACGVYVDLISLAGSPEQCIMPSGGLYTFDQLILNAGANGVDLGAYAHTLNAWLTDDAGNMGGPFTSDPLAFPIDNRAPTAVSDLTAHVGPCSFQLTWTGNSGEDQVYFIFWDGGDGWQAGVDYLIDTIYGQEVYIFTDTLGSTVNTSFWLTDATIPIQHDSTYQFVVRRIDNADNFEYNFNRVEGKADCQAPTACITFPATDGGAYGTGNDLTVIAESYDADIDFVRLWVRDADIGGGVPGTWQDFGLMDDVGGGVFNYTIDSTSMRDFGGFDCVDGSYEILTQATDLVGNEQTVPEAIAACDYGTFAFDWFCAPLPVALISINGAVNPQSPCGFDVTRDDQNEVEINVLDFASGDTYTVDVWVFRDTPEPLDSTRVFWETGVDAMPFIFNLDATDFPKGSQLMKIKITRNDGNMNSLSAVLCVPDENAPMAYITTPVDGQWVGQNCLGTFSVIAQIDPNSYDLSGTTKVEFYEALYDADPNAMTWSLFDVVTSDVGGDWIGSWNNCGYSDGDMVSLRAIFYDNAGNTYTTAFVTVTIDASAPDISMTVLGAQDYCDMQAISNAGVTLSAAVISAPADVDSVVFYYSNTEDPDIFAFYTRIGQGLPASSDGIYQRGFGPSALTDGKTYRFRAIAYDITGHAMWDYDGDGLFDDNTFDAVNNTSDALLYVDKSATEVAISRVVVTDGPDFPTPSTKLGGAGRVYAMMGSEVTVWTWPVPQEDTCCLGSVVYYMDGTAVATSEGPVPYEVTFNPMDYIDPKDIDGDYYEFTLRVEFTDCFGQQSSDEISFYLLDNTANDVVFVGPFDGDCVGGTQWLYVTPVSDYEVTKVEYYWRMPGDVDWNLIGYSTNSGNNFPVAWTTVDLADGEYELGAISYDPSGNASEPTVITVNVANTAPEVQIISPADMAYVATGTPVEAEVISGTPERMVFQYKPQTSSSWQTFGTDFHPPWVSYFDATSDGYYHLMVRARNCGDALGQSEIITVFLDNTEPFARITSINGVDAGQNDPDVDVTGMSEVTATAYVVDDRNDSGNSGLAQVGFYLTQPGAPEPDIAILQDAIEGQDYYNATFDISGLGTGTYYIYAVGIDNVGNWNDSRRATIRIYDETAPTMAIAGYYGGMLYGWDWSGDASSVLFERWDEAGSEWVGIGVGQQTGLGGLWSAAWSPNAGTYTIRVIAADGQGNFDDQNALTAEFTMNGTYSFGTSNITLAVKKNTSSDDLTGVLRAESPNGEPFVFGIYAGPYNMQHIMLDPNLQNGDLYFGSFNANSIDGDGEAVFFASYPNAAGDEIQITMTSFMTYEVLPDFGTNGTVEAFNGDLTLSIDDGSVIHSMTAVLMETWIPQAGIYQDNYRVITNPNGYGWYVGCNDYYDSKADGGKQDDNTIAQSDYYCCFNDNKYATVTMYYDATDTTSAENLAVAWWDDDYNEWRFDGIVYPAFVEGFNTTDHYVQFATECLHGLYAVVTERDLPQTPTISINLVGDMSCGYFPPYPVFLVKVEDMSLMKEIDTDTWNVSIDDYTIAENGDISDYFDFHYESVTNILTIVPDYYYDDYWDYDYNHFIESLACGAHTLTVGVKNMQGAYREETFDFTIDCAPPTVTFDNGYVGKNPTIEFYVTDDLSGVDTSSIHVDVLAIQTSDTNAYNPNQYEQLFFLQTFFPGQISIGENGLVSIPTTFELEDERAIVVVLYDGNRTTDYNGSDPVASDDWDEYYEDHHGIHDCVGNAQS
jgi:uncharacterized protein (DUF427 family)